MSVPHRWHHLKSTVVPDFSMVTRPRRKHKFATEPGRHFPTMKHGPAAMSQTLASAPQPHGSICISQSLAAFPAPCQHQFAPWGSLTRKHGSNEGWWQDYASRPLAATDTTTLWGSKGKEPGGHGNLMEFSWGRVTCSPRSWEAPAAGGSPLLLFLLTAIFLYNQWKILQLQGATLPTPNEPSEHTGRELLLSNTGASFTLTTRSPDICLNHLRWGEPQPDWYTRELLFFSWCGIYLYQDNIRNLLHWKEAQWLPATHSYSLMHFELVFHLALWNHILKVALHFQGTSSSKLGIMCIITFSCKLWRYPVKLACFTHYIFNILLSSHYLSPTQFSLTRLPPKSKTVHCLWSSNGDILTDSTILSCSSKHQFLLKRYPSTYLFGPLWHRLQYILFLKKLQKYMAISDSHDTRYPELQKKHVWTHYTTSHS